MKLTEGNLIIEDGEFELVEATAYPCRNCVFRHEYDACTRHACASWEIPVSHVLHGKDGMWIRNEGSSQ